MAFLHKMVSSAGNHAVVVEDDDRVAYAYLLVDGRIVADVWLYNRVPAPAEPGWRHGAEAPFLNPVDFAGSDPPARVREASDLGVIWSAPEDQRLRVTVTARGEPLAILERGARPGWCRNARRDGPLAKVLTV